MNISSVTFLSMQLIPFVAAAWILKNLDPNLDLKNDFLFDLSKLSSSKFYNERLVDVLLYGSKHFYSSSKELSNGFVKETQRFYSSFF